MRTHALAVAVDDADDDQGHEAVEQVELGWVDVLAGHQPHPHGHLYGNGHLDQGGEPPERPTP